MKITLNQPPLAQKRARFRRMGNRVITYDPQKKEKTAIKFKLGKYMRDHGFKMLENGAVSVSIASYIPIPISWSKKKKSALQGRYSTSKPDVDNLAKLILDCMNKIVYDDDKLVACLISEKFYSDDPRVEITVEEIDGIQD